VNGLKLPALKGLGSLADCEPIIVDTREQTPLPFRRFQTRGGALLSGDYSVAGLEQLFAVERKSIGDVVACCVGQNRERFERELHRLRGFRFKGLLVVGNGSRDTCRSSGRSGGILGLLVAREMVLAVNDLCRSSVLELEA
jgi:ERCC4-type nuclease